MEPGGPDRNLKMPFFPQEVQEMGLQRKNIKESGDQMKSYTHVLVSQQRDGAGNGGREESLPFLSLN